MVLRAGQLFAALALVACDQGSGRLHGDWLDAVDCKRLGEIKRYEPFDMGLDFASVTQQRGAALIRLSPSARSIDLADQVVISVADADVLRRETLASEVTLPLAGDGQGEAELTLMLLGRCTHTTQALAAVGTVTFQDYGWKEGARIRGEMSFDLVDRRSGMVVGENFVGEFDFDAMTGAPHTAFSPKDY